jgi:probable rRNA maturation factor
MRLRVAVGVHCRQWIEALPDARQLARQAARAAFKAGAGVCGEVELGVVLTGDSEQRRLNRDFRGRDAPTNVLSFAAAAGVPPAGAPLLLGDVVLAFETVAQEAAARGRPLADRLTHLVVHGTLHLLGWDHQSEAEAAAMELLETAILAKLGVADPYIDTI